MDFFERNVYSPEHEQFRAAFRSWLDREIVPHHEQWEADGIVPREVWLEAGKHGFLGYHVPEEFGGGGVDDYRFGAVMQEEVSDTGVIGSCNGMTLHNDIVLPYYLSLATQDQKARWLPRMVTGELISAIAITEPNTGSDMAGIRTSAVRRDGAWVVNGAKTFISNGINSDLVLTVVGNSNQLEDIVFREDGLLLSEARLRIGFVAPDGRPRRMPDAWRAAIAPIMPEGTR